MDGWAQKLDQLQSLVREFSTAQRVSLSVVSLAVLALCGWLGYSSFNPPQALLLGGKTFSKEELTRTLEAFKTAGLNQHHVEGQRISVPGNQADRYTAAAIAQKALPAQFAAEFDRMQSRVNVFTSSEQRRELLEEARKTRLAQILRAIPEIEDAVVEWDRPKSVSLFRPQNQLAAHVSVRPRNGHELSAELVQSLKQFVAGALAGATPEDVTVVDMNTSRVYGRRTSEEAVADRIQSVEKQAAEDATRQITRALQYIPHVLISVNVELLADVEEERSEAIDDAEIIPIRHQSKSISGQRQARSNHPATASNNPISLKKRTTNAQRVSGTLVSPRREADTLPEFEYPLHKSIQVAIAIPEDFYSTIARRQGIEPGTTLVADSEFRAAVANIKMESQRDIHEKLARLLPSGTDPESISITSYTRLESPVEPTVAPKKQPLRASRYPDWAAHAGIIVSGLCGLWLLTRWMRRSRRATSSTYKVPDTDNHMLSSQETNSLERSLNADDSNQSTFPESEQVPSITKSVAATSTKAALNPYSAILAELADREQDTVLGAPSHGGMFEFLCQLAPADLADFLRDEHPQTIALVTSGLPPTRAAEALYALPEALRWDVTQRISRLGQATSEVCRDVAKSLSMRLRERQARVQESTGPNASKSHDGTSGTRSRSVRRKDSGTTSDPLSASATDRGPVSFEDICVLDRASFAMVVRSVDAKSFAVALFDRPVPFQQKFVSMLPRSLATAISQQTYGLGPLRLSDITASQNAIAAVIWSLAQQGAINLPPHLIRARKV
jgi:flagellar motor switch protein FliG